MVRGENDNLASGTGNLGKTGRQITKIVEKTREKYPVEVNSESDLSLKFLYMLMKV